MTGSPSSVRVTRCVSAIVAVLATAVIANATAELARAACASPTFGPASPFSATPGTLAPADYDVDGTPDVAIGNTLLYGDGTGGFGAAHTIPGVRALAAVDLGGVDPPIPGVDNAAPELVAESAVIPGRAVVGLGTGDRAMPFTLLAGFPVFAGTPLSSTAADLTGDRVPDLVLGYGPPTNELMIWKGVGGGVNWGSEVAPVELPFDTPAALAAGDFDDDGVSELVAVSRTGNSLAEINFRGGSFITKSVSIAGGSAGLAAGDVNGDGFLDAVVVTAGGKLETLLGTGDQLVQSGSSVTGDPFGPPATVQLGGELVAVALGDLNGDQRTDAAVADRTGARIALATGDGAGGFAAAGALPTGTAAPTSVALGDLDHDGAPDVVSGDATDAKVVVRRNACAAPPIDIAVTGLEVTQGIQDLGNSVDLVAGRRTFVRVYADAPTGAAEVTARLARTDASGTVIERPLWPANPDGRIAVKAAPDRTRLGDSFLFELPPSWTQAGTLRLRAEVNPDHLPVETSYANDTTSRPVTFMATDPIKIELLKVTYFWDAGDGSDCGRSHTPTDADLDAAESALRRMLPAGTFVITRGDWNSGLTFPCTINIAPGVETGRFADALAQAYAGAPLDRLRVGIVDRDFIGGIAHSIPGWFAISQAGSPDTVVHEVGHLLGRRHVVSPTTPPCSAAIAPSGVDAGYPYPDGLIGGPADAPETFMGFDPGDAELRFPLPRRVVPATAGDMMTYCRDRWPSDYTWRGMRDRIQAAFQPSDPTGDFLSVTGTLNVAGTAVTGMTAIRRSQVSEIAKPVPGGYHLKLLDTAGAVLSDTEFTPGTDHDGNATRIDETVPFRLGTRSVRIADAHGSVVGSLAVSATPPVVSAVTLDTGSSVPASGRVTVSWTSADADGDDLVADVLWSGDGGVSFVPVASGISGSSVTLDAARLTGTHGRADGVVRVFVRDPVLSATADRAGITAAGSPPAVRIAAPYAGESFIRGQNIGLEAFAADPEDGDLTGSVTWSSDRDGVLGSGGFLTPLLSAGTHVLTATVTDADGHVTTDSTVVHVFGVLPAGSAPLADAGSDQRVDEGAAVTLSGLGSSDPDGDPLTYSWRLVDGPARVPSVTLLGPPATPSFTAVEDGTYRFELTVSDERQGSSTDTVAVTVENRAPAVSISSPADVSLILAGPVTVRAPFADEGALDTHTCTITWDVDRPWIPPVTGEVSEDAHTCMAARTLAAGVYTVQVAIQDDGGGEGTATVRLVVYDPTAGSVRGRGMIASPAGAMPGHPQASGPARFSFRARYTGRAPTTSGASAFAFRAGGLRFRSGALDWLVVAGLKAQISGTGRVNGVAGYRFLLTANDDKRPDTHRRDRLRIKIWNAATGAVIYDNVIGAPEDMDSSAPQAIARGWITIVPGR